MKKKNRNSHKRKQKKQHRRAITHSILLILFVIYCLQAILKYQIQPSTEVVSIGEDSLPRHTYNWNNINEKDGKKQYTENNKNNALIGIDISKHQGKIDWQKVKNDDVDFAMLRVGYRGYENGKIVKDKNFDYNIKNALASGIVICSLSSRQVKYLKQGAK